MKCIKICAIFTFYLLFVDSTEINNTEELKALAEQIEIMKGLQLQEMARLRKEVDQLKKNPPSQYTNYNRNEQLTLQWAKTSMSEIRSEMRDMRKSIDNSVLLRELHDIRNKLKQALVETADLAQLARTQEARLDKLDSEVSRLKYEGQPIKNAIAQLKTRVAKLDKEVKTKLLGDMNTNNYNEVLEPREAHPEEVKSEHTHKYRHNKMVHTQISRLARSQTQLDELQQSLQTQVLDVQRRMDRIEEPNWNLLSAKVEFLEIETGLLRNELKNTSEKMTDLNKVHASMLELREDVESIENKADKTIPEFRKEISKLDISFAQLNAQSSYLKEDQENLRQSVKAIAVSVSNTIDRAELDRLTMKKINDSVCELKATSKQHFYRLNDHILKSEANNNDTNGTEIISLHELMGEVKELQPVQREYEDLVSQLPKDCSNITGSDGKYLIRPGHAPFDTWCSNGSTLIQRRYNGSIEFNRKFAEYVHGFGDASAEYWLGLKSMNLLTADNCSSMRIDMIDIYGGAWYAEYEHFSVGNADTGFVLDVSGFKGNASDAFEYQNHMEFSAIDRDRDISNTHCAGNYEGGWWFSHCQHVNINGKYNLGLTWFDSARNEWIAVASSEMRMYRRKGCS
ncbi:protein scabrous-like [Achroia grisella]|uniref:protein scabrous-like n=1 Tax=Achroia grisella TaxID=688607 RepID=UPI0027D2CFA8|nr:protein scabrous-like [Achroia grisella]